MCYRRYFPVKGMQMADSGFVLFLWIMGAMPALFATLWVAMSLQDIIPGPNPRRNEHADGVQK